MYNQIFNTKRASIGIDRWKRLQVSLEPPAYTQKSLAKWNFRPIADQKVSTIFEKVQKVFKRLMVGRSLCFEFYSQYCR